MGKHVAAEGVRRMKALTGCKLFGAYRTAVSVRDAAVLIHSTAGCNWGTSTFHIPSRQKDVRQASSVLYEDDIVYGGCASLEKALGHMSELYDCSAVFVLTGCVAEIMEDNVEAVVRGFSSVRPVLLLKAAGFKGDMASGVDDAMGMLVGHMTEKKRKKDSVNIVGIFSDDYRSDADLNAIRRLLGEEIEINSVLPYDNYVRLLDAPAAELNVVFEGFEHTGALMEQKFGIPYAVVNYPYGIEGSKSFAGAVTEALGKKGGDCLKDLERRTVKRLEMAYGYVHKLYGMPAAVSGDRARAGALKAFLENELGMDVEAFRDGSSGDGTDGFGEALENSGCVIVFGSSYERETAENLGIPLIRYAYPVFDSISIGDRGYAGFDGTVNLAEDVVNAFMTMKYRRDGMYG